MVSEFMPPTGAHLIHLLEVLVGCIAVRGNAEQVAYPDINMFVCSIATW